MTPKLGSEITPDQVEEILAKYATGFGTPTIARQMKLNDSVVRRVVAKAGVKRTAKEAAVMPQKYMHKRGSVIL